MILILSESKDKTTDIVVDWLTSNKINFVRINETDLITSLNIQNHFIELEFENGLKLIFNNVDTFWHRKGKFNFKFLKNINKIDIPIPAKAHLLKEWSNINEYLFNYLFKKKGIFNKQFEINKLIVISLANEVGLHTPPWLITNKRNRIPNISLVTKAISDSLDLFSDDYYYTFFTEKLKKENYLTPSFFPSFFQTKIEKFVDIRSIYLKGKIWSMAIFDKNNKEDVVDFRKKYDDQRNLPIDLPEYIVDKLCILMKNLDLDFGAIDLIFDNKDQYYFLEVNPFGQFEMVSAPCNYNIENEIAKILINYEKKVARK